MRPAFSGAGGTSCAAGSASNCATGTANAQAIASSVAIVTFSEPRSTFRKMSCDRFTRTSIEGWAGAGAPVKIEGTPFTVPVEYWNNEVWQALENRPLECEQQRQSPRATRPIVRLLVGT